MRQAASGNAGRYGRMRRSDRTGQRVPVFCGWWAAPASGYPDRPEGGAVFYVTGDNSGNVSMRSSLQMCGSLAGGGGDDTFAFAGTEIEESSRQQAALCRAGKVTL